MGRKVLQQVSEYVVLCRDDRTGIAWVEDGSTGMGHSCHPSIDSTGSVLGMKERGYWRRSDRAVRCSGAIYNIDSFVATDDLDWLAAEHCQCGGKHLVKTQDGHLERRGKWD